MQQTRITSKHEAIFLREDGRVAPSKFTGMFSSPLLLSFFRVWLLFYSPPSSLCLPQVPPFPSLQQYHQRQVDALCSHTTWFFSFGWRLGNSVRRRDTTRMSVLPQAFEYATRHITHNTTLRAAAQANTAVDGKRLSALIALCCYTGRGRRGEGEVLFSVTYPYRDWSLTRCVCDPVKR